MIMLLLMMVMVMITIAVIKEHYVVVHGRHSAVKHAVEGEDGFLREPNISMCVRWLRGVHRVKGNGWGGGERVFVANCLPTRETEGWFPTFIQSSKILPYSLLGCSAKIQYWLLGYQLPAACPQPKTKFRPVVLLLSQGAGEGWGGLKHAWAVQCSRVTESWDFIQFQGKPPATGGRRKAHYSAFWSLDTAATAHFLHR